MESYWFAFVDPASATPRAFAPFGRCLIAQKFDARSALAQDDTLRHHFLCHPERRKQPVAVFGVEPDPREGKAKPWDLLPATHYHAIHIILGRGEHCSPAVKF